MTTQQLVNYFNVLQDKYGSPNVIESEVVSYLNHATNEWLNRLVPDSQGGVVNFEEDSNITAQVRPLIFTLTVNSNGAGMLTNASITAALTAAGAEVGAAMFRPMSMLVGTDPVKYTKQNNITANLRNSYKEPTSSFRQYTQLTEGLQIYPAVATSSVRLTVLKTPRVLALPPSAVNPELEDYVLYNILTIALQLAGIATRDQELNGMLVNGTLQGAK